MVAIGARRGGRFAGNPESVPGKRQRQRVGEIVACIGKQGKAIGAKPEKELHPNKAERQQHAKPDSSLAHSRCRMVMLAAAAMYMRLRHKAPFSLVEANYVLTNLT